VVRQGQQRGAVGDYAFLAPLMPVGYAADEDGVQTWGDFDADLQRCLFMAKVIA